MRLFLFKYFNIKAVISLPNSTFEPFTSTKTSLLFAQKKNKKEVEKWNELWEKYGKEWSLLLTRINDYNSYFVEGKELNKKWAKDVITDIEEGNIGNITKNIKRFLKDYISKEDEELSIKELLTKFKMEIINLSKYEKETNVFGFYNAWWVFGEVSKELNYTIFMAEAENIGYKRTKRGESLMPNDLYDLEYAPNELKYSDVINSYVGEINDLTGNLEQLEAEKKDLEDREKQNVVTQKKTDKLTEAVNALNSLLETIAAEKEEVENILTTFYANDLLKEEYEERTDMELISQFKNGLLSRYRSDDILLRKTTVQTILDAIRQEVVWK
ncbi:hypothetical protein PDUR_03815 [Paenibacillus durus]|uniref:Uncharacterized protein n=1 Tax=Paenibacillus durus TaxID=44251 RepID=A0A089J236_PAEDU|nr:hypothetical protein PDUR_03815 [Paenibacillus durus]